MKVGVVGTGYVGLVTGTCFAELGNEVICIDNNADKVASMKSGKIPIYEPGLEDLFHRNIKENRLTFSTELNDVIDAEVIFLALPTPPGEDGSADLSYILGVADQLGSLLKKRMVIVNKSTVPVGTAQKVTDKLAANASVEFAVASNPEFLREGQAVADFMKPERIVIGTDVSFAKDILSKLYQPLVAHDSGRMIITNTASAEMIKYAANAFLATKISFMNQISGLCELVGADVDMVRRGIGSDSRIGEQFLFAGPGYGGSCFPKDVLALLKTAQSNDYHMGILGAVITANDEQKQVMPKKIADYFGGSLKGKKLAVWGLAFKGNTDDVRESPAIAMVEKLLDAGAHITAFDPQATKNAQELLGDNKAVQFVDDEYQATEGADALVIATAWSEFSSPDFAKLKSLLKAPIIFDARNMYALEDMKRTGFYYESIGRQTVTR